MSRLRDHLRAGGSFPVVEYDTDHGNHWLPHSFSYAQRRDKADRCDFRQTRLLASLQLIPWLF